VIKLADRAAIPDRMMIMRPKRLPVPLAGSERRCMVGKIAR